MKKKVISLLIALSMACSLCACGSSGKDTSTEQYALENAVFMGIAKFINGLETKECAEVLYNLAMAENNSETIPVTNDSGFGRKYHSITMFGCVISENIQFE